MVVGEKVEADPEMVEDDLVMPEEWGAGNVRIKDLESGEEIDISFDDL